MAAPVSPLYRRWYGGTSETRGIREGEWRVRADRTISGGKCVPGALHAFAAVAPQGPVAATSVAGTDIGDRVNHALKSCALQCTVYIPAGNYSFSTPIRLELNPFGKYKLSGDPGAVLSYKGSGDAIPTTINNLSGSSQLLIEGFQLTGNTHAAAGIHTMPTNRITIRNMVITGFTGGDGILVEGTNSSNIYDNLISNNKNGIRLIPTVCSSSAPIHCGTSASGPPFAANAIHVTDNQITSNAQWAIFEDTVMVGHGLSETLNNLYMGNDFEGQWGWGDLPDPVARNHHHSKLLRRITPAGSVGYAQRRKWLPRLRPGRAR